MLETEPKLTDIREAADRIAENIHCTPVMSNATIDKLLKASIFFKCENFQKTGSFKIRGATNLIKQLAEDPSITSVATHSSGNHAQAVSLAATNAGLAAHIVMPENATPVKIYAVRDYGGRITLCKPTLDARETGLKKIQAEHRSFFVPPYDHYDIICGQATAARELIDAVPDLDLLLAPVGGGGLLAGTALSASYLNSAIRVFGCEPAGAADAKASLDAGKIIPQSNPNTLADGLLTSLGERNFPILSRLVEDILLATDEEIIRAMRLIWERMKIIVEPSCAVPLACLLKNKSLAAGKKIGIILSGGNTDIFNLPFNREK